MCDYSQHLKLRRRPAMVGDELELVSFGGVHAFAKWWRARGANGYGRWLPTCLQPGTEVVFEKRQVLSQCRSFVECDNGERILVNDIMPREARFAALPGGLQGSSDGLEFSNGLQCGLSAIELGARLRVLQLPVAQRRATAPAMSDEPKTETPPSVQSPPKPTVIDPLSKPKPEREQPAPSKPEPETQCR